MLCGQALASPRAPLQGGRTARRAGRSSVVVRAGELELARNIISLPKRPGEVQVEGESTVTFLGAGGQEVPVTCRKVRWRRGHACGLPASAACLP